MYSACVAVAAQEVREIGGREVRNVAGLQLVPPFAAVASARAWFSSPG